VSGRGAIGIDVGGTKLLAVRLGPAGQVDGPPVHMAAPRTPAELIAGVVDAARALTAGATPSSIGVGVPGLVDGADRLVFAPNLSGATGAAVGAALRDAAPGAAVWVGNDATAAAWGERTVGAGQGATNLLAVTLGTGIGGGIVADGRLVEGAHRFAGEFGHMVVDPNGPRCPCGKQGCWERFASGAGLGVLGREAAVAGAAGDVVRRAGGDPEQVKGEHVTATAAAGDPAALEIMDRFGWWVSLGLANLANLLDPEVIVIGGGLVEAGEVLMNPIRRIFPDLLRAGARRPVPSVVAARLGQQAGAVGAGLLARDSSNAPGRSESAH
jgi:glucokinase